MSNDIISKIQLPDNTTYDIADKSSGYITGMTILSYGHSTWNDFTAAYSANRVVYCRASSNSNPASGSQTRLAFMAYVDNETSPTNVEFQYYRSVSSHSDSQQGDQMYVYKLTSSNSWTVTVRESYTKMVAGTGLKSTYSSGKLTLALDTAYGDTVDPYAAKTANYVLAGPTSGSNAVPSFRALVSDDIPDLSSIYLTSYTETDPTVPSWAKESTKPSYSFSEIDSTPTTISGYGLTDAYTKTEVDNLLLALPEPMLFKGSLGTGGTITTLPAAATSNEGFVYKVITDGTYASQAAKVGDTFISDGSAWVLIPSGDEPVGTVTSVGVSNATDGGLTISGSPITSSGSITVGHTNVLTSAQTTEAVYPIKIDKNGHISSYGSAVTIPTVPLATESGTTGISVADHSTTSIYGVSSSTTSVTGVSGSTSVYGVKSGTNSTTTASKASGANGTAPSWTFEEVSIPNVTAVGSASNWTFEEKSIPNVTAAGSGSASLSFTMDTADTKKLKISFSHTHTAPTLGTTIKVQSKSGGSNGSAPTLGTAIKVQSKSSGNNGSASTWSFSDVTVPIRADSATTVPTAASSSTIVPIKNSSSTTVVTSKTHSITDNGHTHAI